MSDSEEMKTLLKAAIKESVDEWMDRTYRRVGKWTVGAVCVFIAGLLAHIWLAAHTADLKLAVETYIDQAAH